MPVESWAFAVPQAMIPPTTRTDAAQNGRTKAVRLCITLLRLETRRGYSGGGAELCVVFRICSYAATSLSEWLTWRSFYARHLVKEVPTIVSDCRDSAVGGRLHVDAEWKKRAAGGRREAHYGSKKPP